MDTFLAPKWNGVFTKEHSAFFRGLIEKNRGEERKVPQATAVVDGKRRAVLFHGQDGGVLVKTPGGLVFRPGKKPARLSKDPVKAFLRRAADSFSEYLTVSCGTMMPFGNKPGLRKGAYTTRVAVIGAVEWENMTVHGRAPSNYFTNNDDDYTALYADGDCNFNEHNYSEPPTVRSGARPQAFVVLTKQGRIALSDERPVWYHIKDSRTDTWLSWLDRNDGHTFPKIVANELRLRRRRW